MTMATDRKLVQTAGQEKYALFTASQIQRGMEKLYAVDKQD